MTTVDTAKRHRNSKLAAAKRRAVRVLATLRAFARPADQRTLNHMIRLIERIV